MKRNKAEIEKARKETLATFQKVDDNIRTMVYKASYGLDELLDKGVKGLWGGISESVCAGRLFQFQYQNTR